MSYTQCGINFEVQHILTPDLQRLIQDEAFPMRRKPHNDNVLGFASDRKCREGAISGMLHFGVESKPLNTGN